MQPSYFHYKSNTQKIRIKQIKLRENKELRNLRYILARNPEGVSIEELLNLTRMSPLEEQFNIGYPLLFNNQKSL